MYPLCQNGTEEGFNEIAAIFEAIAISEKQHENAIAPCWPILKTIEYLREKHR